MSTTNFNKFAMAVKKNFDHLSKYELFCVDVDKDVVWEKYLASFPVGYNPIFRTRTEHDCSCCKNFIRNIGNVVAIIDGEVYSVWDIPAVGQPYDTVCEALTAFVEGLPIKGLFRTKENSYGADFTRELLENGTTKKWEHFCAEVKSKHRSSKPDEVKGDAATSAAVLKRGLEQITAPILETILDLINNNSLYRGAEHKQAVLAFEAAQQQYTKLNSDRARELFVWENFDKGIARFRNTVIGSLAQDLATGADLEDAVKMFESKVAPENYKRPTALITPRMVQDALKTIHDLGLEPALERRFAKLTDVSVNDVLFVNQNVASKMKEGPLHTMLMEEAKTPMPKLDNAEAISIEKFLETVVPSAKSIQLFVRNAMLGNFVSITAPVHADPEPLFRWDNNFAWSYDGNVTDSIKERVKRAGGRVEDVALRISLAWFNTDDLDIHVIEPNGNEIYFGNKSGKLDVDMNAYQLVRDPVENVRWVGQIANGVYKVSVNNYHKRESIDVGFVVEIESAGVVKQYSYNKAVGDGKTINVAELTVVRSALHEVVVLNKDIVSGTTSQNKWGVDTETLVNVNALMLSPNYWGDNATGNKHWFFILEGCVNPEPIRGIYNEFLSPKLNKHRKVFEILGDKTKCQPTPDQLSGVGFSSTKGDIATVVVQTNAGKRAYTIAF